MDFHPRQQSVSYCDAADGEIHYQELHHERDDLRSFYSQFAGEVIVGPEASGYSTWFEQVLTGLGHRVWIGDAAEIRRRAKRRQKNDRRDAELILDLLLRGEFPRVRLPPPDCIMKHIPLLRIRELCFVPGAIHAARRVHPHESPGEVFHGRTPYTLLITGERLLLHAVAGLFVPKERVVAEPLADVRHLEYTEVGAFSRRLWCKR